MKPLAIVTPWFGKNLTGGAEQQAWQVATRLASRGHKIEVLTTCCRSFHDDWAVNHFKAGVSREAGLLIRRFPVTRRDRVAFDQVNRVMLSLPPCQLKPGVNPVKSGESAIFSSENINSPKLLNYLSKKSQSYQAFLFIPYLYGIILNGLPLVSSNAFLQPCLHDEVYACLPEIENIFHQAKGLLFNSDGEAQLAIRLYSAGIIPKSLVVGEGIEVNQNQPKNVVTDRGSMEPATLVETFRWNVFRWNVWKQETRGDKEKKIAGINGTNYQQSNPIGKFPLPQERFILYLGRRDPTKNTNFLVTSYLKFKQNYLDSTLKLVLAGSGNQSFDHSEQGIIDLGLVDEQQKAALLTNCIALFQPSRNESFSRVMMEAWFYGKPVAANRDCLATAMAVESSQGGWLAGSEVEWAELFAQINQMGAEELVTYGRRGQAYAKEHAVWDKVIQRYEVALGLSHPVKVCHSERSDSGVKNLTRCFPTWSLFSKVVKGWANHDKSSVTCSEIYTPVKQHLQPTRRGKLKEIHQLLPNLAYGDAISNQALAIRDYLRRCGYQSDIFVRYIDERVAHEAKLFNPNDISEQAGIIYHHSIGSELTDYAIAHPGSKCLIYHNITPAEFFRPYRPDFAQLLEKGRAELKQLAQSFPLSVGDSAYNAAELAAVGFHQPGVLPIAVNPSKWDMPADATLMEQLQDGKSNLLFVGRISPNKCQIHLVESFYHYLTMDQDARLILAGWGDVNDPYCCHLLDRIQALGLKDYVLVSGLVSSDQLLAFYRTAHLFWSMSEHEGFGVPLVEALWFDVPVLANKSSAVPETLGEAGILFTNKDDLVQVAALAKLMVKDWRLRKTIIKAQQKRRDSFLPNEVNQKILNLCVELENQ
ncbi:glycosyltransferase [Coleofasciculus sp. F4-SAH-05]|uniref:glycosyltransferase n=1 Tax=Coleofasciculus sp. F4-SAH-05 TaxID=3069525 RepID=UPI0032F132F7